MIYRSVNQPAYGMENPWIQHNRVSVPSYAPLMPHGEIRNRPALPSLSSFLLYQAAPYTGHKQDVLCKSLGCS